MTRRELDDLEEVARSERERDAQATAAREAAARRDRDRERDAARRRLENAQRAPTGPWRSMRGFALAIAGGLVLVMMLLGAAGVEDTPPARYLAIAAGVLAALAALLALDAATWRRRLPFSIDGYDRIDGRDTTGDNHAPLVRVRVTVTLRDRTAEAERHRERVLEILAARVNRAMTKDDDVGFKEQQRWRVDGDAATGEASMSLYTNRLLERWLRREVRLLARVYPVERVTVAARYTGTGYWIPTGD